MATPRKIRCTVEKVDDHGRRVYTLLLKPDTKVPRFKAGQFTHLTLADYDPSFSWPESRVFSIASSPQERDEVRITYSVKGAYTRRMEAELCEGSRVWLKLPYGDFVIKPDDEVVLLGGGTGMAAFTAFLEDPASVEAVRHLHIAYGVERPDLLIYQETVKKCIDGKLLTSFLYLFSEQDVQTIEVTGSNVLIEAGRISLDVIWPRLRAPERAVFYLSGPPAMIASFREQLKARGVCAEHIRVDDWE